MGARSSVSRMAALRSRPALLPLPRTPPATTAPPLLHPLPAPTSPSSPNPSTISPRPPRDISATVPLQGPLPRVPSPAVPISPPRATVSRPSLLPDPPTEEAPALAMRGGGGAGGRGRRGAGRRGLAVGLARAAGPGAGPEAGASCGLARTSGRRLGVGGQAQRSGRTLRACARVREQRSSCQPRVPCSTRRAPLDARSSPQHDPRPPVWLLPCTT